ncbi:NAD(P)/FAD-dependent oxidoreductase [Jannaschia sp. Os4]|uniref:flavin-containing monooxygenase n=1 Tax=Jannaschia sp. Os4 TaxID=2807617 RepID=UPI00193A1326|nr:NAD(P)/FAD-dependent oxidoreductase [Jannaschia sp. Os4]MBM2575289.1 NAD(P)/FAD-dependent oxidoreductase [Jannaschia sp. Os4]
MDGSPHPTEHLDVAIIGAGLSGICAAWHVQNGLPDRSYALLEMREATGGTWDLFRYPGVRSDSDMPTLGYAFRPWTSDKAIADASDILAYIRDTASEAGIDRHVRTGHKVVAAAWDTPSARWTLTVETAEGTKAITASFVIGCTGYYDYDAGHRPDWPGFDAFAGETVHPQHWPEDLDVAGKAVCVIGSGATAVTLVPELARRGARVTMLQRTPTWIVAMPAEDGLSNWMRRTLGERVGHGFARWKNVLIGMGFFQMGQRAPGLTGRLLNAGARRALPEGFDVETHLTAPYKPWDQRLCLIPDGDLFEALSRGDAEIVTGRIDRFEADGVVLEDGAKLTPDVVVTATGLRIKIAGGMRLTVDGAPYDISGAFAYRGAMFTGLPNLAMMLGYTNASWTLKCELIARYAVRLMRHMDRAGHDWAMPERPPEGAEARPVFELSAGYLERARDRMPKQSDRAPWRLVQNYLLDLRLMRWGDVTQAMRFGRAVDAEAEVVATEGP